MSLILMVIFIVLMVLWVVHELGVFTNSRSGLLAWGAVLCLALMTVFHL